MSMNELREKIDAVDADLVAVLCRRFALAKEMRELKAREGLPRVDAAREAQILAKVASSVPAADVDTACAVYEAILRGSRGAVETIVRGVCVRNGRVLLCQPKRGGYFYLPGGHIDFGETAAAALVRELQEETGLAVSAGTLLGVVESSFEQAGKRHSEINLVYSFEPGVCPQESGVCPQESGVCPQVESREDWISFVWWPVDKVDEINILPREIIKYIRV